MKTIKFLATAFMFAVATTASAQFTNTSGAAAAPVNTEGWNSFYVQYNPTTLDIETTSDRDGRNMDFTGFSVGWNKAFSVSKDIPLFVEAGIGLQYLNYSDEFVDYDYYDDEYYVYDAKINVFSAKIPVSLMYNWQIPNSKFSIAPYAGLYLRANITGKMELSEDYDDVDADLFDDDDMDGEPWKRVQFGYQIGVNARYNNVFAGISYGGDFSEIAEESKFKSTSITLGFCF